MPLHPSSQQKNTLTYQVWRYGNICFILFTTFNFVLFHVYLTEQSTIGMHHIYKYNFFFIVFSFLFFMYHIYSTSLYVHLFVFLLLFHSPTPLFHLYHLLIILSCLQSYLVYISLSVHCKLNKYGGKHTSLLYTLLNVLKSSQLIINFLAVFCCQNFY